MTTASLSIGQRRPLLLALPLVMVLLAGLAGGRALGTVLFPGGDPMEGGAGAIALVVLLGAGQLALLRVLLRRVGLSLSDLGWRRPAPRDLALGLLGLASATAALLGLLTIFGAAGAALSEAASFGLQQRLFFATLGIVAACTEETVFRGYLQPALAARHGGTAALLLTAALFALYHLNLHPLALLGRAAVGLVYGVLRDRTGGLWAGGIAHALVWTALGTV